MFRLIALLVLLAASAQAQSTSLTTYVNAQLPIQTNRAIGPQNVRNAILAYPNNVYVSSSQPVTTTSYVTATTYYGDGSHLTGVSGGSSTTPGGVSGSVQFNNGTSNSLGGDSFFTYIAGLLQVPSVSATNISVTGPISASTYYGDGSHLTGISAGSSNYNSLTNVPVVLQNISNSTGSVTVTSINAAAATLTSIAAGSLTASGIVSANTLDAFFISGTQVAGTTGLFPGGVTIGNGTSNVVVTGGNVSATGLLTAPTTSGTYGYFTNISATNLLGLITTAAQPNITSLGTQTNVTTTNLTATLASTTTISSTYDYSRYISTTQISSTGNISGLKFIGDGSLLTGINGMTISATQNIASASIYVGRGSGGVVTSGINNAALGDGALASDTTGASNVAVGASAMASTTTGGFNTALGHQSLFNNRTLSSAVAAGYQSMQNVSTTGANANSGVGVGYQSLQNIASVDGVVAVGLAAAQGNAGANGQVLANSVFVGAGAAANISSSVGNSMVGHRSGVSVSTGSSNTLLGSASGGGLTTGSNNIAIGAAANLASTTASNQMSIANQIFGLNMVSGSNALIGLGTQTPTTALTVSGTVSATAFVGDGSALTNLPAGGTPAAIVSGTTRVDARTDGTISLTTGGVVTGYFDTSGRLVVPGISATTNQSSFTTVNAASVTSTIVNALNVSMTNVYLNSTTLLSGQSLYVRNSNGQMLVDGSAGYQYDFNTDRSMFSSTDLAASQTPSATVHVSGTLMAISATFGQITTPTTTLDVYGTISGTIISATTLNARTVSLTNATCTGTCTGFASGSGTSISTTTFTAASNTSGSTAIGFNAAVGTAISQTAIGASALAAAAAGANNTAIGSAALALESNGQRSTAVGAGALNKTTVSDQTAVGYQAGFAVSNGINNTLVGSMTGLNVTTGQDNSALGYEAGQGWATNSLQNVAIGSMAGGASSNNGKNTGNTAVGYAAAGKAGATQNIVAVGFNSGQNISTGSNNTLLGASTGLSLTTGGSNIIIGSGVNSISATVSSSLNIGSAITGNIGSGTGLLNLIGINVTSPTAAFEVSGTVKFDSIAAAAGLDYMCYDSTTGLVTYSLTTCTISDRKFKINIAPYNGSLDKILAMQVRQFDFKNPAYGKGRQVGLIAQEVQTIAPALVSKGSNGDLSVDYAKLSVYAVGAIQELNAKLAQDQEDIKELRAEMGLPPKHATFGERVYWLVTGQ